MTDNQSGSGSGSGFLYFVVGGLVVVVAGLFLYYDGYLGSHGSKTTTEQVTSGAAPAPTTTKTTTEKH